jgi:hypothetical protein
MEGTARRVSEGQVMIATTFTTRDGDHDGALTLGPSASRSTTRPSATTV